LFRKILVANRGEIACRIIRTARRMGIATVAVYSTADRGALHVEEADEAILIGDAPVAASYLSIERMVAAAGDVGADAVHPGYGFLSENPAFPRALADAGIVFVGPPPAAIEAMGDKLQSKRLAAAAGVNIVPGHLEALSAAEDAVAAARRIGFPVILKASAGGGGKGMRVAHDPAQVREGFALARSEARSSFGDDRILVEKFIERPRHIEIQVLADSFGNIVHLGERECSIQRRNQKIVEEAPSAFLDGETREAMGAEAVALARAVGYASAGTIEFIVGADRRFYFLEMNTRLQVEHPVTELVTGIDLVEEMIRIAAGEKLRITQADVQTTGWAIEARLYAEDPFRNFLPSIGRLRRFRPPAAPAPEEAALRLDAGVVEGSEVPIHYDPMIAKLCTHAADRTAAIDAMADALDGFVIDGIRHNLPFLAALMRHPRFRVGALTTAFVAEEWPDGFRGAPVEGDDRAIFATVAAAASYRSAHRSAGAQNEGRQPWRQVVALGRDHLPVTVVARAGGLLEVSVDGAAAVAVAAAWNPGERVWRGAVDGRRIVMGIEKQGCALLLTRGGAACRARLLTQAAAPLDRLMPDKTGGDAEKLVRCPMPGTVVSIFAAEGQKVEPGEMLAIVEAMKMENVLRAERGGVVARIHAKPGDSLAVDAVILEFA
jgi:propionyl-CoA carboxylase alpha chain